MCVADAVHSFPFVLLPITDEGPTWACQQFSPLCHTWSPLVCSYLAITSQEWQQLLLTFVKGSPCLLKMLLCVRPSVRRTHRRSIPSSCPPPSVAAINSELPLTKSPNWAIHPSSSSCAASSRLQGQSHQSGPTRTQTCCSYYIERHVLEAKSN